MCNACVQYSKRALAPIVSLVTILFSNVLWLGSRARSTTGKGTQGILQCHLCFFCGVFFSWLSLTISDCEERDSQSIRGSSLCPPPLVPGSAIFLMFPAESWFICGSQETSLPFFISGFLSYFSNSRGFTSASTSLITLTHLPPICVCTILWFSPWLGWSYRLTVTVWGGFVTRYPWIIFQLDETSSVLHFIPTVVVKAEHSALGDGLQG